MERNRWETAIRCLEVALHPHTTDEELIAGVNGFRRTADGTPLRDICIAFASPDEGGRDPAKASAAAWQGKLDRVSRENLDLRRQLAVEKRDRLAATIRLREAERNLHDLGEEDRAAHRRAADAERRFTAARATTSTPAPPRPAPESASPFQQFLAAARQRMDPDQPSIAPTMAPLSRTPWTA
jgi:BMFP domain-containing protein YqiC